MVDTGMEVPKHIQDALGRFLETFRFFKNQIHVFFKRDN
jgi:hypothetical protein